MPDPIRYIGIARKAGTVVMGETNSGIAVRSGKACLLATAADSSENALHRAQGFVYGTKTLLVSLPYTKNDLSAISGAAGCSMAAFTDPGLAAAFMEELAEGNNEYMYIAHKLGELAKKQRQRRVEKIAHERNKALGKSKGPGKRRNKK